MLGGMAREENLTTENDGDVGAFLDAVPDERRRADAWTLLPVMERATGEPPRLWGTSIVGFGRYHYRYASGREGDAAAAGFSPRRTSTTVYVPLGFDDLGDLLGRLGPHTTTVSCLHVRRLDAVDLGVLEELVRSSYARTVAHRWE
ncbi:hypothetical protein GCM10023113_15350 [Cellulomonas oligotrophica]|uniref:YdhG-like domain-containing protein n=2 Tax=Cellulomonas oligotrophica TaxID=931536 RepID=A0ABQ4D7C9_9CELL|nr:hypothetical protein Col01nite_07920 [Cellulomonas oligotrophica]